MLKSNLATAILPAFLVLGCAARNGGQVSPMHGKIAPDFELVSLEGRKVKLSDLRGKPVILTFFGLACPPCRAEAPHLSSMARKYAKNGLVVLAVNQWDEDRDSLRRFVLDKKLEQLVLLEGSSVGTGLYGVTGVPATFWINRDGVIVDSSRSGGSGDLEHKTAKLVAGS